MAVPKEEFNLDPVSAAPNRGVSLVRKTVNPVRMSRRPAGNWMLEIDLDVEVQLEDGRSVRFVERRMVKGKQFGSLPRGKMAYGMNGVKKTNGKAKPGGRKAVKSNGR